MLASVDIRDKGRTGASHAGCLWGATTPPTLLLHLSHPHGEQPVVQDVLKRRTDPVHDDNRDAAVQDGLLKPGGPAIT